MRYFDLRPKVQHIAALLRLPQHKGRQHRRSCLARHMRQPRSRAGLHAKVVHKGPLRRRHVRVHQEAHSTTVAHRRQQAAPKVVLMQNKIPMHAADAVHKRVQPAIVEPANHNAHAVPHQRVVNARKLPRAQVPGNNQHSLAPALRLPVVFQPLVAHPAGGVFRRITRQAAKLHKLPTKMLVHAPQNARSLLGGQLGQRHPQVAFAHLAQPRTQKVDAEGQNPGKHARKPPRHTPKRARNRHH